MRIGIDWGGTKLEIIALDDKGETLLRERVATPQEGYQACINAVCNLVSMVEEHTGKTGTVGIGIPGTISSATGLVKNANSVWMNGKPLREDMQAALQRKVRIHNDANCFTVSEAVDGAARGQQVVVGVILGTGCGSGVTTNGKALVGIHGIAGEFGHTPLTPMTVSEHPGSLCWCGRRGCLETWISGTGFQRDYEARTGIPTTMNAAEILEFNDEESRECYSDYCDRLARGLSVLVNIIDPDVIVLGGGMSNVNAIYEDVPPLMKPYVFSDVFDTPVLRAKHGDSSGVRGAAWLW
ncbi:MAG: ROK family protein [Rhizobiaceae bacterium]